MRLEKTCGLSFIPGQEWSEKASWRRGCPLGLGLEGCLGVYLWKVNYSFVVLA